MSTGVYFKVTLSLYASFSKAVQFADEILRVENNSCAYKAECVRIENTRRDEVELVYFTIVYDGMTCVVTAL